MAGKKIYILYFGSTTIRVFSDQAPFDELREAIQIPTLGKSLDMLANAASRSIFISDGRGYIYKIQMPTGEISRGKICSFNGKSGFITRMSNSMLLNNCLVTSFLYGDYEFGPTRFELQLISPIDSCLKGYAVTPLPNDMKYIGHVVHSPKNFFIISYSKTSSFTQCWISILSCDGERIRTFEPELGSVLKNPGGFTFAMDDDRNIFVADFGSDKVIWMNSNLTDYRNILQRNHEIKSPCNIVYIPEKRQLLVQERNRVGPFGSLYSIYVFHLSPCNLVQQRK